LGALWKERETALVGGPTLNRNRAKRRAFYFLTTQEKEAERGKISGRKHTSFLRGREKFRSGQVWKVNEKSAEQGKNKPCAWEKRSKNRALAQEEAVVKI